MPGRPVGLPPRRGHAGRARRPRRHHVRRLARHPGGGPRAVRRTRSTPRATSCRSSRASAGRCPSTRGEFEALLWGALQHLHDHDDAPWAEGVAADPDNPHFAFSVAGTAFFVVGLHPNASRVARRAPLPTLVFNLHEQFERMRADGRYQRMRDTIRRRDTELQGFLNPMVSDHGETSEARQYAGRAVPADWTPPFEPDPEAVARRPEPAPTRSEPRRRRPVNPARTRYPQRRAAGIRRLTRRTRGRLDPHRAAERRRRRAGPRRPAHRARPVRRAGQRPLPRGRRTTLAEVFSSGRTTDYGNSIYVSTGSQPVVEPRRVMAEVVDDTVGVHDLTLTPCSQATFDLLYPELGGAPHPSCFANLCDALAPLRRRPRPDRHDPQRLHGRVDRRPRRAAHRPAPDPAR